MTQPRQRPENVKDRIVKARAFETLRLQSEDVAEFGSDAAFKKRLEKVRADMVERSSGMLTAAAGEAVRTLLALQKEAIPAAVRLGAARAILEIGLKMRQMVELEQRLGELEEQVAAANQQQEWRH